MEDNKLDPVLQYQAGLRAGFQDESLGIVEPEHGYPNNDPYLFGVEHGREWWRFAIAAMNRRLDKL